MSLKVTTGMVAGSNMGELHFSEHIREMIAEMNVAYRPTLSSWTVSRPSWRAVR